MARLLERVKFGGHGQGSLTKYDDGPNWISVYNHKGQEHRESTGTPDLKQAKRWHKNKLDELAADRQGLKPVLVPAQKRVTVAELLDALEGDIKLRGLKSAGKVGYHTKPIRSYFGTTRAVDVTAETVDKYIATKLAAGKSHATVNRGTQALSAAFKLAVERGKLTQAPKIRKLSETGNARRVFFEQKETEAVLDKVPDYLRDAVIFFSLCGWRKSEVVGLRWEWVDMPAGTITLPDSKNGRGRLLVLEDELLSLMKRREADRLVMGPDKEPHIAEYVFHRKGRCLGDFKRAWHTALREAGFSYTVKDPTTGKERTRYTKRLHDFRRSVARNLVRAGVREGVAMGVTGHKTRAVFERYNITAEADLREAMKQQTAYLANLPTQDAK